MNSQNRSARRAAFAAFVAGFAAHPAYGRLSTRFGAYHAEAVASLPGDGLVPLPMVEWTRALTIDAPPERIWPWLAQMGPLTPAALHRDLDEAADMGAAGVCVYRLAGLAASHAAVLAERAPEPSGVDDVLRKVGR